ncbi:MAG: hydrogenase expression/formation protein HypE [Nitrospinae bacterium]|nr:hydrogenase expression/formation protein HypE [Nitrospinota bacterium]
MGNNKFITKAHGGGGTASAELVRDYFLPAYGNSTLNQLGDQAIIDVERGRLAFTTDSYVVDPIFFPGGNIGELAIFGTVNDIAMSGARPIALSVGFILHEGFPMEDLKRVLDSMAKAAKRANVEIVTGDTKVVSGGADQLYINSSGIGIVPEYANIAPTNIKVGDKIILSGTIGDHGIAVLTQRKELRFESKIESDTAPLYDLVKTMLSVEPNIRMMRDPTRGGVASTLNEVASAANLGIVIDEKLIPIREDVKSVCEILGLDPLQVANEGKLIAFVPPELADKILEAMRTVPEGKGAAIIGEVTEEHPSIVEMKTGFIGSRIVEMMVGDQLPRIC